MGSATTATRAQDHITYAIAEWAAGLTYKDLSPGAIEAAKLFLYDSFGCALGGSRQHDVAIALDYAEAIKDGNDSRGGGVCTVIGSGFRCDPVMAALLNALCIRAMDYNDIYWKADPAHPTDIIPAAALHLRD